MQKYLLAVLFSLPLEGTGQTVVASWYDQPGLTASGSKYDPTKLTAAHKSLPFGTEVSLKNGDKTVKVKITDRGPFVKGRQLDLSKAAARRLDILKAGVTKLEVIKISKPLDTNRYKTKM